MRLFLVMSTDLRRSTDHFFRHHSCTVSRVLWRHFQVLVLTQPPYHRITGLCVSSSHASPLLFHLWGCPVRFHPLCWRCILTVLYRIFLVVCFPRPNIFCKMSFIVDCSQVSYTLVFKRAYNFRFFSSKNVSIILLGTVAVNCIFCTHLRECKQLGPFFRDRV